MGYGKLYIYSVVLAVCTLPSGAYSSLRGLLDPDINSNHSPKNNVSPVEKCSQDYTKDPSDGQYIYKESVQLKQLCFCENSTPVCDVQTIPLTVVPGGPVTLSVTSLDGHYRPVSAVLYARFTAESYRHQRVLDKEAHILRPSCTNITFTVLSSYLHESVTLSLYPVSSSLNSLTIDIEFLPCPNGFISLPSLPGCVCAEYFQQIDGVHCRNNDYEIERQKNSWLEYTCLGSSNTLCGVQYHDYCPYHYCDQSVWRVNLSAPNSVCAENRAGVLCGGCAENYSAVIGSSDCWDCRDVSGTRTLTLALLFAAAGILLVGITIVLDLRISRGRLNGLIFYAAVVNLNQDTFFPPSNSTWNLFFSWLNLDLGFSACSYDGMKTIEKLWLQLAFPAYILLLILIIAIAFQFSETLSNSLSHFSSKAFPSSVTLFLLAYLKILRISFSALPFTKIHLLPQGSKEIVWLYDGNIGYFDSEHIKFFIFSVVFLVFIAIPYTFVLISSQFLFKLDVLDSTSGLSLSIFLDAYLGKTKPTSQFWFGILLVSYTFQVTVYHFTGGDMTTNLVVAILCACLLLSLSLILDGPYFDTFTNKLEQFYFLNIIAVSALHIHFDGDKAGSLSLFSDLLMSVALINFLGIILERFINYGKFQLPKQLWEYIVQKQSPDEDAEPTVPTSLLDEDPDWTRDSFNPNLDTVVNDREPLITDSLTNSQNTPEEKARPFVPPKTKNITSSILSIGPGKNGEANLVSDECLVIEQNVGTDKDGINTLNFRYIKNDSCRNKLPFQFTRVSNQTATLNNTATSSGSSMHSQRTVSSQSIENVSPQRVRNQTVPPPNTIFSERFVSSQSIKNVSSQRLSDQTVPPSNTANSSGISQRIVTSQLTKDLPQKLSDKPSAPNTGNSTKSSFHSRKTAPVLRPLRTVYRLGRSYSFGRLPSSRIWKCPSRPPKSRPSSYPSTGSPILETYLRLPRSLFESSITVIEVTGEGETFNNQGLSVCIPPGAICDRQVVKFEIGILSHGPFECPASTTRVSPILWFCCRDYVNFEKDIQITLPHCLRRVTTQGNDDLGLCFMKADCLADIAGSVVNFNTFDQVENVTFMKNSGTLLTTDKNCFFCIVVNQIQSLLVKKIEYCLTRIDPKPWTQDTTVYFCVSYLLNSCLEDIKKQFPPEQFDIKSKTCFQFASSGENPSIYINVTSSNGWLLAVEHPGNRKISASEVHFSHDMSYKLKREFGIYPPRFQLRVCGTHAYASSTACVSFTGIVPPIDCQLLLTVSASQPFPSPVSPVPQAHVPYSPVGSPSRPRWRHSCDYSHTDSWQDPRRTASSIRWSQSDYDSDFIATIIALEESKGFCVRTRISWPRLQPYIEQMAPKWKQIGTYVIHQWQLETIQHNRANLSIADNMREVLQKWEKAAGYVTVTGEYQLLEFYWSILIVVLQRVGEGDLAMKLIEDCQKNSVDPAYY